MRVLIVAFGSHGDVLPLVAIGAELRRRGHEVILGSAEPFAALTRRAGIEFEILASEADYHAALGHPDLWRPIRGLKRLFRFAEFGIRPVYDFIERRRDKGGTLVVASTLAIGARLAHDALKIPLVTVHLSPFLIQSRFEPPKLPLVPVIKIPPRLEWEFQLGIDEWFVDPLLTPQLNAIRAELSLPPIKRLRHWWNAPRRVLLMCPDWFAAPQPDWPTQIALTGFPKVDALGGERAALDPAVDAFLAAGEPPVAITFGTAMTSGTALYRDAVKAALKCGRRCLVMSPVEIETPAGAGDRVLQTRYAPFGAVLPRCAAFIHHGGVGSVAQGFAAGVPQLIVPLAFDQFDNAARVRKLGCGLSIGRLALRAGWGAGKLAKLLASPEVSTACARVAALNDDGAVARASNAIEAQFEARRRKRSASHTPG